MKNTVPFAIRTRTQSPAGLVLPTPRGPLSAALFGFLRGRRPFIDDHLDRMPESLPVGRALIESGDVQLTLWVLNLIDSAEVADVDPKKAGSRAVRELHVQLERCFEHALVACFSEPRPQRSLIDSLDQIRLRAGIDVAALSREQGAETVARVFADKSPYLAWEADPHTLLLARLEPELKRDVADIQSGEYGVGYELTHAQIYRGCLEGLGIDLTEALEGAPAASYAFANSAWLFGRQRRLRGLGLGQLCLIEIDSVEPCAALVESWNHAGLPPHARKWLDIHVLADEEHERVVREKICGAVETSTPWLLDDVWKGALITRRLQDLVAESRLAGEAFSEPDLLALSVGG